MANKFRLKKDWLQFQFVIWGHFFLSSSDTGKLKTSKIQITENHVLLLRSTDIKSDLESMSVPCKGQTSWVTTVPNASHEINMRR